MNPHSEVVYCQNQYQSATISQLKEVSEPFTDLPEIHELFFKWYSQQHDSESANSLLKKLDRLSLSPSTLTAVLFYLLYPEFEDLPQKLKLRFSDPTILYQKIIKVHQFPVCPKDKAQAELTLRMLLTVLADVQLLAVFLVLQLQQLENKETFPSDVQNAKAWTALHVHAPLAGRLGIFWIKAEMEDLAFQQLEPESYQDLKQKVARKRSERAQIVKDFLAQIEQLLTSMNIPHKVKGRYKRFYSIFQKLEKVENDYDRILDLIGFRVLVENVDQCYATLSYIHESWTPKENRFKDYISKPKPNGYQSLHTTVLDADGDPIEIQIRTYEMHRMAEYGVAAHWLYKEQKHFNNEKQLEPIENSLAEPSFKSEDQENIPLIDLFNNKIYVMTPNKEIRELSQAATPIDFAYAIHTEVGNRMTGAKANGNIVKLDSNLRSGDTVEILTSPRQEPKKEWLDYVTTRHARSKIKHALHERNRDDKRKEGIEILEREFKNYSLNLKRMTREGLMEQESRNRKNQEYEHILFCVGEGSIKSEEVRKWFAEDEVEFLTVTTEEEKLDQNAANVLKSRYEVHASKGLILVDGMDNVSTRMAQCCAPELGCSIQGFLTQERVITIHRKECSSLALLNSERLIEVHWNRE